MKQKEKRKNYRERRNAAERVGKRKRKLTYLILREVEKEG
jgi:hypothetical protein